MFLLASIVAMKDGTIINYSFLGSKDNSKYCNRCNNTTYNYWQVQILFHNGFDVRMVNMNIKLAVGAPLH